MEKPRRRYILALIMCALFFLSAMVLFESRTILVRNENGRMNNLEFFVTAGVAFLLDIGIFLLAKFNFRIKEKKWLWPFLIFFFLTSLTAIIFFQPIMKDGVVVYSLRDIDKARYSVYALLLFTSIHIIISYIPHFMSGRSVIRLVFLFGVVLGLFAAFYSYIFEIDFYRSYFNTDTSLSAYHVPQSYTTNRNIYGLVLFIGLISEAYLAIERPHWWRLIIISFFFVNQFFVLSKTCLVMSLLFLPAFVIYCIFRDFKHKHIFGAVALIAYLLLLSFLFWFIFFAKNLPDRLLYLNRFRELIQKIMSNNFHSSMLGRYDSINLPIQAIKDNPFTIFFGFGYGHALLAFFAAIKGDPYSAIPVDSALGLSLIENGVFGFLFSLFLWVFIAIMVSRSFLRKSRYAFFYLLVFISLLGRTLTESSDFILLDVFGLGYFSILALPLLIEEVWAKKDRLSYEGMLVCSKPYQPAKKDSLLLSRCYACLFVPAALVLSFSNCLPIAGLSSQRLNSFAIIAFLIAPLIVAGLITSIKSKKYALFAISLAFFVIAISMAFAISFSGSDVAFPVLPIVFLFLSFALLLFSGFFQNFETKIATIVKNIVVYALPIIFLRFIFEAFYPLLSTYLLLVGVAFILVYALLVYFMPKGLGLFAPFDELAKVIEDKMLRRRAKREVRYDAKIRKFFRTRRKTSNIINKY